MGLIWFCIHLSIYLSIHPSIHPPIWCLFICIYTHYVRGLFRPILKGVSCSCGVESSRISGIEKLNEHFSKHWNRWYKPFPNGLFIIVLACFNHTTFWQLGVSALISAWYMLLRLLHCDHERVQSCKMGKVVHTTSAQLERVQHTTCLPCHMEISWLDNMS